jgi:hypothetical protein
MSFNRTNESPKMANTFLRLTIASKCLLLNGVKYPVPTGRDITNICF